MTIYEAIGCAWVVFTSSLASIAIFVFAYRGMKQFHDDAKVTSSLRQLVERAR